VICKFLVKLVFRTALPVTARGRANAPRKGGALIVANHQSYLDPPLVGAWLPRQFHAVAREGLFQSRRLNWIITRLNAIPVREDGEPDANVIRQTVALLRAGELVLIFPEGTRTETGDVGEFKRGVGLLLKRAGTPVIPAAIVGAFEAWPRSRKRPRLFSRLGVKYGPPIESEALLADGADAALDRLRAEVIRLKEELSAEMGASR